MVFVSKGCLKLLPHAQLFRWPRPALKANRFSYPVCFQKWTLVDLKLALLFWAKLHAWPPPPAVTWGGGTAVSAAPQPVVLTRPGPPPNRPYRPFSL